MKRSIVVSMMTAGLVGSLAWLAGCQSAGRGMRHQLLGEGAGHPATCRLCYGEDVEVTRTDPRQGIRTTRVVKKHMCPGCKSEDSARTRDERTIISCAGCVPTGDACDVCSLPEVADASGPDDPW